MAIIIIIIIIIIINEGVRSMISFSGSRLSLAKLVMMSSAPAKSAGDMRPRINVVPINLDSIMYLECVLSTSNAIMIDNQLG